MKRSSTFIFIAMMMLAASGAFGAGDSVGSTNGASSTTAGLDAVKSAAAVSGPAPDPEATQSNTSTAGPISVSEVKGAANSTNTTAATPGFEAVLGLVGILAAAYAYQRKR